MRSVVLHGAWLAITAAAFAVGHTWGVRSEKKSTAAQSAGVGATRGVPTPQQAVLHAADKSLRPGVAADDSTAWVRQFIGSDGKISAEKMAVAIQDALREGDPIKSMMNFGQLIKNLTAENAAAAFKAVRETVTGFETMRYLPMLTYAWGAIDGENALAAMKDMNGRDAMLGSAATLAGWASVNPAAAKKWVEENGSQDTRWMLNRALITGMARNDLEGATQYVMGLDEKDRGNLVDVLAEQKIKLGLSEATQWALGLQDASMKGTALERVAQQFTRQDITKAADWVKQYIGEPFAKDAVGTVAREYAQKDPKGALGWAQSLAGGDGQSEAYGRIFREWGRSDPTAASETLNRLPAGAPKDGAISSFARTIARESPEDAITWAATIQNQQAREDAQIEVVQRWRMSNADAASQWATTNLSPDAQQKATQSPRWDFRGGGGFGGGGFGPGGPPPEVIRAFTRGN